MSTLAEKCPICSSPAGQYRQGTCSIGCDVVLGDDSTATEALALLLILAVVGVVAGVLLW